MLAYTPSCLVIRFRLALPRGLRYGKREFILWPALMYRVIAPAVRERQIDILEKAVLGLARAGTTQAERIGGALHIDRELAAAIITRLRQVGLLDSSGIPTLLGLRALQEESLGASDPVPGYAFQDPRSGGLWPRIAPTIEVAETEGATDAFPRIVEGSTGARRVRSPYWYTPTFESPPPPPSPAEILRAAGSHWRAQRGSDGEAAFEDEGQIASADRRMARASLVDAAPTPVYLYSYLFTPEGAVDPAEWMAADPFGLGTSDLLRTAVVRESPLSRGLGAVIDRLTKEPAAADAERARADAERLEAQAIRALEERFTIAVRELPQFGELQTLQVRRLEVEQARDRDPSHRVADLLTWVRRAVEATMDVIAADHPVRNAWRLVYQDGRPVNDQEFCRGVYEAIAGSLGLEVPLPKPLAGVRANQVKAAAYPDGGQLRGRVIAAVLAARDDATHPLRRVAAGRPRVLHELDGILDACNRAAHTGVGRVSVADACASTDLALTLIGSLMGLAETEQLGERIET